MKCQNCQEKISPFVKECPHCHQQADSILIKLYVVILAIGRFTQKTFSFLVNRSIFYFKKMMPHLKKFLSIKRNVIITLSALSAFVIFFIVLGLVNKNGNPSVIELGKKTVEVTKDIQTSGGVIKIDDTKSSIFGLELSISPSSYDQNISFTITTQPIINHTLGEDFNPITPLITIDNHHKFSNEPMVLTIPIELSEDEFAMGFYFNPETNKLEGIPFKDITENKIVLYTSHFSSIVVSKVSIQTILSLTSNSTNNVDTGFLPGVDDWQFTNYGSFIAPGGHCAGQVLTMSWYYETRKVNLGEPSLTNRFDNNGFVATKDFHLDDSDAYRFASVIQNMLDFQSDEFHDYLEIPIGKEYLTFYAFSYAMMMTKSPQLMAIYSINDDGQIVSGHAILAYKFQGYDIFVADPNYPGQLNRKVHFNTSPNQYVFDPYSSGANAQAILNDGALLYNEFFYIGESALIDYNKINEAYQKMLNGTIGDLEFPTLEAVYLDTYNQHVNLQSWTDILGHQMTLGTSHNEKMACHLQNKVVIAFTANHPNALYTLFNGTTIVEGPQYGSSDGYIYYEIDLTNGINEIGVLLEIVDKNAIYYADFMRIKIDYTAGVTTPCAATIIGRYNFDSRSDGQVLVYNHYIEIKEDGTFVESYNRIGDVTVNRMEGTWRIEPGLNAGENILYLTFGSQTDRYDVLDNYQWLRYGDSIIFLFKKVN